MNKYASMVDRLFKSLGYVLVPAWRWLPNTLDTHLKELFELRNVTCVIDVGANEGQYRDFLRYEVGYKGWIVSFEPVSALAGTLRKKAQGDPRWRIYNMGLGAENHTAEINVMRHTQFSSMLKPDHTVVTELTRENAVVRREQIRVSRLADMIPELQRERIPLERTYFKTDTQGYDLKVLEGAKPFLTNVVGMQLEMSFLPIYEGMPTWSEALAFVGQLGFDVTGLYSITRDRNLRLIEADCVFTRRPSGPSARPSA